MKARKHTVPEKYRVSSKREHEKLGIHRTRLGVTIHTVVVAFAAAARFFCERTRAASLTSVHMSYPNHSSGYRFPVEAVVFAIWAVAGLVGSFVVPGPDKSLQRVLLWTTLACSYLLYESTYSSSSHMQLVDGVYVAKILYPFACRCKISRSNSRNARIQCSHLGRVAYLVFECI
jgi:hypothetical protein